MNPKEPTIREILEKYFAERQWEGQGGNNIPTTGREIILNQTQLDQAHSQILALIKENIPKKPLRLPIQDKDKLIELLHKFKGLCCVSHMGEVRAEYLHMEPCIFCRVKDDCGIATANAIEDLFDQAIDDCMKALTEGGVILIYLN